MSGSLNEYDNKMSVCIEVMECIPERMRSIDMEITFHNARLGVVTTTVSEEDADLAFTRWHLSGGHGPVGSYVKNGKHYMHRVVAHRMGLINLITGEGKSVPNIDHIDGNKLNNRRDNLRLATHQEQRWNPNNGVPSNNKSGVRGVSFIAQRKKWYACGYEKGKSKNLGLYDTLEEAVEARRAWERSYAPKLESISL